MTYDPEVHHRRSIRWRGFDYRTTGAYFVTVCPHEREPLLSTVGPASVELTEIGRIVETAWHDLADRFPGVGLDAFIVMPDHVHGIVFLRRPSVTISVDADVVDVTLGRVIGAFKSISVIAANRHLGRSGARFWQRNFHERVIRDDAELDHLRWYIEENPARWRAARSP